MGMPGAGHKSWRGCTTDTPTSVRTENGVVMPNKYRYRLLRVVATNTHVLAEVKYEGCGPEQFHGVKILMYDLLIWRELGRHKRVDFEACAQGPLDPHFLEGELSPMARFPGTQHGWDNGLKCLIAVSTS